MPALTQETLNNVLETLKALHRKAQNNNKNFRKNLLDIEALQLYIEEHKLELANEGSLEGYYCRKEIIDKLAALRTKDPDKKKTISDLIDQFTSDDVHSVIYAGLKKLEFTEAFSKFISRGNNGKIDAIIDYIKNINNRDNFGFGSVEDKARMSQMFQELAKESKDSGKLKLIYQLQQKLDGCFLDKEDIDLTQVTLNEQEVISDWNRFFEGSGIVKVGDENITSIDGLKGQLNNLFNLHNKVLTPSELNKILQALDLVNACGTDRFLDQQRVVISQDATKHDAAYNFVMLPNGNLQVEFRCSAQAAKPGGVSGDEKKGEIAVTAILTNMKLEVRRRFDEKVEHTSSSTNKKPKRP